MVKIKGIIFDLDGTLIDSLDVFVKAFNQGINAYDLGPISKEELAGFLDQAMSLGKILQKCFPNVFNDEGLRRSCEEKIKKAYFRLEKQITQIPYANEVLSRLKEANLKVGVVTARTTSGKAKWVELKRLGLAQFIDAIVTGAEAPRKPAPDGIIKCLNKLKLKAEECVYIGNSQADLIAGKKAGVKVILFNTREVKIKEAPILQSLKELLKLIPNSMS